MSFGTTFLKDPGQFPADPTGVPWGPESVGLTLTGSHFAFSGLSARQAAVMRRRYAHVLDAALIADAPPIPTHLYQADPGAFHPFERHGRSRALDWHYQPTRVCVVGLNLMVMLDWSPRLSVAIWSTTEAESAFCGVIEHVFRLVNAYAVLDRGGVLLHSAGVSDGTAAWIGFGHSGAGKSTLSGLALGAGRRMLSDDLNALRYEDGRWLAQRFPFAGTLGPIHGDDRCYPVAGICRLLKGPQHRLDRLPRPQALAALVASAPCVNQDPYRVFDLMAVLESLLRAVDCHDLTFRRDAGFWHLLNTAARVVSPLHPPLSAPEFVYD